MKYVIVLGDGMADYPVKELNNQTPLQRADLPVTDHLAERGLVGLVKTVPDGMSPGSDTANLCGTTSEFYKGRSPLKRPAWV